MLKNFFNPNIPIRRKGFWKASLVIFILTTIPVLLGDILSDDGGEIFGRLLMRLWMLPLMALLTYKRFVATGWRRIILVIMGLSALYVLYISFEMWVMKYRIPEYSYYFSEKKVIAWIGKAVGLWRIWDTTFIAIFMLFFMTAGLFSSEKERAEIAAEKKAKGKETIKIAVKLPPSKPKSAKKKAKK